MIADRHRHTHTHTQTQRQTDTLTTILRSPIGGRVINHTENWCARNAGISVSQYDLE